MPLVKGRELNYKCQSCILTNSHYLRVFFGYFFDGGEGGSFKLNKQEVRCMEESTSASGLGFFLLLGFFVFWLIFFERH